MATNKTPFNVAITRPQPQGLRTVNLFQDAGFSAISQPVFDYQPRATRAELTQLLNSCSQANIIFVSTAAADFAERLMPISQWSFNQCFAVGKKTQQQLNQYGIEQIKIPDREDSEGLLLLPELSQVSGKTFIIVRGDSGREHLAQELSARGAIVHYLETYQKNWLPLDSQLLTQHWQQQQINCILVTSSAILERLVTLLADESRYWLADCLWITASQRIADRAQQLGLQHVINANSANDQVMLSTLLQQGSGL